MAKKKLFKDDAFTPTKWSTAKDKAEFANTLVDFIESGFPRSKFTKKLYGRLMLTFGHIAHYDIHGFWAEWFESATSRASFLQNMASYGCYGDADHTFSDVERALRAWVRKNGLVDDARSIAATEAEERDRAVYETLKARFEPEKA